MFTLVLSALLGVAAQGAADRPNLVFLYTDDQARWSLGSYGNHEAITPNIDRLAIEGALFRNAFTTTPVCSPSRAGLFTGRYGTQVGITDWIDQKVEPDLGLAPSAILWPELLKGGGYTTGLFGKWHLGTLPEFHPTRQGYDHFFGFLNGGTSPLNPTLEVDGKARKLEGAVPDLLVDNAIQFIDSNRARPFLVSIHFREPHQPYAPTTAEDAKALADLDPTIPDFPGLPVARVKELTRAYYASIHSVDRNIGRLLTHLDRLELTGKTIVVFTSDHGYMIGHHGLWHKGNGAWIAEGRKGRRPNMFDDSIRVPLLVRWPGVVKPRTIVSEFVTNLDTFPSVLDMAGIGMPRNLRVYGRSWVPLLRGEQLAWHDTLFGQYDMHHGLEARMRMIRTPEWKLVRHFERGGESELYDLSHDPGETKNLSGAAEHKAIETSLDERLRIWMSAIDDPLLKP